MGAESPDQFGLNLDRVNAQPQESSTPITNSATAWKDPMFKKERLCIILFLIFQTCVGVVAGTLIIDVVIFPFFTFALTFVFVAPGLYAFLSNKTVILTIHYVMSLIWFTSFAGVIGFISFFLCLFSIPIGITSIVIGVVLIVATTFLLVHYTRFLKYVRKEMKYAAINYTPIVEIQQANTSNESANNNNNVSINNNNPPPVTYVLPNNNNTNNNNNNNSNNVVSNIPPPPPGMQYVLVPQFQQQEGMQQANNAQYYTVPYFYSYPPAPSAPTNNLPVDKQ
ncbi:hypothetical protein SAMD00019534_119020 [Acytostelium subglobosum LB1]|uniref:hypothetical protein n=1 Tax=Acytostelium subglobosum LB1 TaxID=1410327 RepID=UPI000644DC57|nr:hypothetical protein SAMD00019534_119020 [Acytostelium subglobosum LB1]GAM28726.1 hypothetical protein SAMD00019534_119020 [Acytostelium subglobosum LB1]|eukprot:XP_012748281.1 hypothetical protein SAMD00019534_119020 [Acytostelium subglobosum LB1]